MSNRIRFAEFELDPEQKSLNGPNGSILLRPQTFAVLCHLLERAPAVVSRDELLDAIWGHQATSPSSVSQTIKELRAALGDSSTNPRLIATRRRLGYQFIGEIKSDDDAAQPHQATSTAHSAVRNQKRSLRETFQLIALSALIALAAVWWIFNTFHQPPENVRQTTAVAIAEFSNVSSDASYEWFSAAMTLFLGHALSELDGVHLTTQPIEPDTAQDKVDYLIEANHQHGNGSVQIVATIRRPQDEAVLTRIVNEYDRADVGLISAELARAIGDWLGIEPTPELTPAAIRTRLPQNVDAQKTFFQARALLDQHQAAVVLETVGQTKSSDPFLLHIQTQALAMQGNILDAKSSMSALLQMTELWPRRDRLAIEATAARLDSNFELAADRLQALNQFFPEPGNVRRMVQAQIEANRLGPAAEALELLGSQAMNDARVGILQARLAEAENRPEQQLEIAQRAYQQALDSNMPIVAAEALVLEANAQRKLGQMNEAIASARRIEELPSSANLWPVRAELYLVEANLLFQQGQLEPALNTAERAEALFNRLNAQPGLAEASIVQGIVLERSGRLDESLDRLNAAIEQLGAIGDQRRLARAHVNLGITLMSNGRPEQALENLARAGLYYREIGDRQGEAAALINHGTLLARMGRSDEAERVFERALEAFSDSGELRGQAITLGNLAALASRRGDTERAVDLNTQALDLFAQIGAEIDAARTAYNLALVRRRLGDLSIAEQLITDAAERFAAQGSIQFEARALVTRGSIMLDMGRYPECTDVLEKLRTLDIENPARLAEVETLHGQLAMAENNPEQAGLHFERARELRESAPDWQRVSELDLARVALTQGRAVQAEQEARRLADAFNPDEDVYTHIDALLLQSESLIGQNRLDEAEVVLQRVSHLLDTTPHARHNLSMLLLRAQLSDPVLADQQLQWIVQTASEQGFAPIADQARAQLDRLQQVSGQET